MSTGCPQGVPHPEMPSLPEPPPHAPSPWCHCIPSPATVSPLSPPRPQGPQCLQCPFTRGVQEKWSTLRGSISCSSSRLSTASILQEQGHRQVSHPVGDTAWRGSPLLRGMARGDRHHYPHLVPVQVPNQPLCPGAPLTASAAEPPRGWRSPGRPPGAAASSHGTSPRAPASRSPMSPETSPASPAVPSWPRRWPPPAPQRMTPAPVPRGDVRGHQGTRRGVWRTPGNASRFQ